jgi:tRNA (adenine57-N1/adenine58-N1)-methyltransferase
MKNHLPNSTPITQPGELAQLVSPSNKIYFVHLISGRKLQTHRGTLSFDDLIGVPWGSEVHSHNGSIFYLFRPAISDLLRETPRNTQIMYPKDIGYTLIKMGIGPGAVVVEAGTGSGAFTTALAWAVGPNGKVYSYEIREEMQNLARKNLRRIGLSDRVVLKLGNIESGIEEVGVDAFFLDIPNPYDYIQNVRQALIPGGAFGCILPTMNQVERLIRALNQNNFVSLDVCEIMLRYYKPVANRLRPTDRMVAHTGYLIYSRPIIPVQKPLDNPMATNAVENEK